ncbi:putative dna polymerase iota [Diaporthe ampelina]|uniref:Putative dna polymerase iota n=1 Tax=Diaporthe ampelina TaxID=1214573 RepID=A0A0G2FTE6_9PEZI|nr:putative dna polymerase iota [Diaporthe ampelina]
MEHAVKRRSPRRKQDRIILHFDYDCFYAQVVENAQPALRSLPLGIKQKSILATCNYEARKRGVKKLQLISDAKKICPDLVLADGEDLSAFRDVSKKLYGLLRSYSWNKKAERLGLDEVFLDVTDLVESNVGLLNRNALPNSFFCLSRNNPEKGFSFDATAVAGCVTGNGHGEDNHDNLLFVKLVLASHLARHLRLKIEEEGYTSACGISTNKVLNEVLKFMDSYDLRQVPGIGGRITHTLESYFLGRDADTDTFVNGSAVKVGEFRMRQEVSSHKLEKLLGNRPGAEKGIGEKVWALLHGVDDTDVKAASLIPTQISIEDTYPGPKGGLNTSAEVERELLNPNNTEGWNIGLINICVANMTLTATEDVAGSGRDISKMFKRQDEVLREFRVYDEGSEASPEVAQISNTAESRDEPGLDHKVAHGDDMVFGDGYVSESESEAWDDQNGSQPCPRCGHYLPVFAISAHQRYHALEEP